MKAPTEKPASANALVALRKSRGFTAGKAAAGFVRDQTGVVGLADSVWAQYESGTRKISEKHRAAIEAALGAPLHEQGAGPGRRPPARRPARHRGASAAVHRGADGDGHATRGEAR